MKSLYSFVRSSSFLLIAAAFVWPVTSFAQPVITDIRFEKTSAYEERVLLVIEKFHPPEAFDLSEPNPRLVFDFSGATIQGSVKSAPDTDGNLVKKIRVGRHWSPQKKVRLVLDLAPGHDYKVNQVFFEESAVFAIMVMLSD